MSDEVTIDQMDDAATYVRSCQEVYRTPMLQHAQNFLCGQTQELSGVDIALKLENLQNTGSFKIRGLVNQRRFLPQKVLSGDQCVVTMSAGNYGKAYGYVLQLMGVTATCIVPLTAPISRVNVIKSYGVEVELVPTREMVAVVNEYIVQRGSHFLHPYDDINLIAAYASLGDEILEDIPEPDVIVVGCGGGALVAGIASRVKSKHPQCRVYGVEPQNACTMYESFKQQKAVSISSAKSVAGGLAPPSAGSLPFTHCQKHVDDILLVSEKEIVDAVRVLFNCRMIVEPAGCACLAALIAGKIPDARGKKVVLVLSGGNVTLEELELLLKQ